jgi:hypothetical protein
MLDAKKFLYDALRNDSSLVSVLGSASKIQFMYPNDFNALPIVTYQEIENRNVEFYDNSAFADESVVQVDVWSNTGTTAIAKLIDAVLLPLLYTREFSADVPEPDAKIFHRVIRYSRSFTADDLDAL